MGDRMERVGRVGRWYVDEGKLAGTHTVVARRGDVVFEDVYGMADIEAGRKLADDSIYRIYSMTKPIASVALLMLYEDGVCRLEDKVSRYIPGFAEVTVWGGERPARPMTLRDLLMHTSGLSEAWPGSDHPVDKAYAEGPSKRSMTLAEYCDGVLPTIPLRFSPGTRWHYGCSTDVVGRVVEILSGQTLDAFLQQRIFDPLGMVDTAFSVPADKADRFTANYRKRRNGELGVVESSTESAYLRPARYLSGAGGLVSTAADYQRFVTMLVRKGDGLIGRKTLEYATMNHLAGGRDMQSMVDEGMASEVAMAGTGFGLGFSVVIDPPATGDLCSVGEYAWGGAASTIFWVDPLEEVTVVFLTQFMPSQHYPLRGQLRAAVNSALA